MLSPNVVGRDLEILAILANMLVIDITPQRLSHVKRIHVIAVIVDHTSVN